MTSRARRLGARRVMVLSDGDEFFSQPLVESFRTAARRLRLDVVGVRRWDVGARSHRALARDVARERVDAVYLAGILDAGGGEVVRDLRAQLGRGPTLIGSSGFTPIGLLFERAGPVARGTYVTLLGVTPQSYGPSARRFAREFGVTQPGIEVEPSALYAADAARALLDAIARSDGSRRSVIRQLFATRVKNGVVG